jgi:hypothetical protein
MSISQVRKRASSAMIPSANGSCRKRRPEGGRATRPASCSRPGRSGPSGIRGGSFCFSVHWVMGMWPSTAYSGQGVYEWSDHRDARGTLMLRSTLPGRQDVFWSATQGGVVRWRPVGVGEELNGDIFSSRAEGRFHLPGEDAQALICQGDTVWVALRDAGLARIVGGSAHAIPQPEHLPRDLLGLTIDHAGHVWCTSSNGLVRYSPGDSSWLHVPVNDGSDPSANSPSVSLPCGRPDRVLRGRSSAAVRSDGF